MSSSRRAPGLPLPTTASSSRLCAVVLERPTRENRPETERRRPKGALSAPSVQPATARGEGPRGHRALLGDQDLHHGGGRGHLRLVRVQQGAGRGGRGLDVRRRAVPAVPGPALLGGHVLVPGAGDRDGRDRRRRHHAPRARPAVRGDLAVLAGGAGRHLLPLGPQRAHAGHPLHHDQPAREVLLVRRLRHLRARDRGRGLRRDHPRPGVPGARPSSSAG